MQKSPTSTPFLSKNYIPLTISLLQQKPYQNPLKATSKPERRHTEGRAKGERRISISSLNIKPLTTFPPLYIIRNKIPKTPYFPQTPIHYPLTPTSYFKIYVKKICEIKK